MSERSGDGEPPADQDPGRVVPTYLLTRGRTRPAGPELPLESLVTATEQGMHAEGDLEPELRAVIGLSARLTSVVEIGAALQVPLGVARVVVSDLAHAGYLQVHLPPDPQGSGGPSRDVLGRLLDGLRNR